MHAFIQTDESIFEYQECLSVKWKHFHVSLSWKLPRMLEIQ
jgi:hypothetical protein